jgi:O-antigen/teichoic acid export membrane protein
MGNDILNALKKNKATFYTTLLGGIFSVIVYISAAKWGGFYEVAYTRILVFMFLTFLTFFFAYKEMKIKNLL